MPAREWITFKNGGGFGFSVNEEEKTITFTNLDHAALLKEIQDRISADAGLSSRIDAEATARTQADEALQDDIDDEAETREGADETLQGNIDTEVTARKGKDVASVTANADGVSLTFTRSDATTLALSLLLVTAERDGLMTKEAYNLLNQIDSRVLNLEHAGVWRGSFDTYADLPANTDNAAWTSGTPIVGDFVDVRDDETHDDGVTRYIITAVSDIGVITYTYDLQLDADIPTATTGGLGLVKGAADSGEGLSDTNYGKIFAEAGGILSMIGADALKSLLSTVDSNLSTHTADTDIHITAAERAKWDDNDTSDLIETVKVNGEAV